METVTVRCWFESATNADSWMNKYKDFTAHTEKNKVRSCCAISGTNYKPMYSKYEARVLLVINNASPNIEYLVNSMCRESERTEVLIGDEFYVINLKKHPNGTTP